MGYNAAPLEKLIEQFSKFPGIGRKGATRMAYQVLAMPAAQAQELSRAILFLRYCFLRPLCLLFLDFRMICCKICNNSIDRCRCASIWNNHSLYIFNLLSVS